MARRKSRYWNLLNSHITRAMKDDSSILDAIDVGQGNGFHGNFEFLTLGGIGTGARLPLFIATGMSLVNGLLRGWDFIAFHDMVLHSLYLAANLGLDVCFQAIAAVCDTEL